jgi:transcriptional regulator with XRE-family HTH domain
VQDENIANCSTMNNFHTLYTNAMGIRKAVSQNYANLRASLGLSAKAFGARLNVTAKHIYDIEDDKRGPSLELLEATSKEYNVAISSLLEEGGVLKIPTLRTEPVSIFAKKLMAIPDEIYELAQDVPLSDKDAWAEVKGALLAGKARAEKKKKSSHS